MIRINQIKLSITHDENALKKKAAKILKIPAERINTLRVVKQSVDARKKDGILYIYSVEVTVDGKEETLVKNAKDINVILQKEKIYRFPESGKERLNHRPVIIGFGPAGIFCGLMLARAGYRPLILERGQDVDTRKAHVDTFWEGGALLPDSNVQFGEGGAGTFSDGKLNTLVKDPVGRNRKVLEILVEAGAPPSILYVNKPHIGTDVLSQIVKTLREEIIRLGGEVRFGCRVEDILYTEGNVTGLVTNQGTIASDAVILAIGHSARDTFEMLAEKPLHIIPKAFAVGLRIQHPQRQIDLSQYKSEGPEAILGAADYKLTRQLKNGRGLFSFCMCPGGYVVNASSEKGKIAVNGMSNHKRDGVNANSAIIVTVTPEDFPGQDVLSGVAFQRKLEEAAFRAGHGTIPVQLYGDFKNNRESRAFGEVEPAFMGKYSFGNLWEALPEFLASSLTEGIDSLGGVIKGFNRYDAILAGVESRTSSPLRIPRDDNGESSIKGLYPCGEGAGYAGGITSAAMDGIRTAEILAGRFAQQKNI